MESKFFTRGKVHDLRIELSNKESKRANTLKKIIANMTMGNDMSGLFPDILNCMPKSTLQLKKLLYLYLVFYARSKPDYLDILISHLQDVII